MTRGRRLPHFQSPPLMNKLFVHFNVPNEAHGPIPSVGQWAAPIERDHQTRLGHDTKTATISAIPSPSQAPFVAAFQMFSSSWCSSRGPLSGYRDARDIWSRFTYAPTRCVLHGLLMTHVSNLSFLPSDRESANTRTLKHGLIHRRRQVRAPGSLSVHPLPSVISLLLSCLTLHFPSKLNLAPAGVQFEYIFVSITVQDATARCWCLGGTSTKHALQPEPFASKGGARSKGHE